MRKILLVAAFFLTSVCFAAQAPVFDQANAQYKKGDFKGALENYEKLLRTGQATAAVYYNMGNAALKTGEKGQALVYYERARKAAPRDIDLEWNIRVLRDTLKDTIEDKSHFALSALKKFLGRWTTNELAFTFTAFLALSALLSVGGLLFSSLPVRGLFFPITAALIFSGVLLGLKIWDVKDPRVVVLDREVPAFYGPSDSETKAFVLHEGAEGRLMDESGDWLYVVLDNKNGGWLRKNACEIV